jgi:hypothetical protein
MCLDPLLRCPARLGAEVKVRRWSLTQQTYQLWIVGGRGLCDCAWSALLRASPRHRRSSYTDLGLWTGMVGLGWWRGSGRGGLAGGKSPTTRLHRRSPRSPNAADGSGERMR